MKKALVVAHLGRHFRKFGHYDYKVLLEMGYEVHIAANFSEKIDNFNDSRVIKHQINFKRNPFSLSNIIAKKQLEDLFSTIHFNMIHCQSPSGGAVTRLASAKVRKKGTKVIYTAHGLHFYSGAPIINWILYFNVEKVLGRYTDYIITINDEDYMTSKSGLKINNVRLIHGVGVDLNKFNPQDIHKKNELRKKYGYKNSDFILIYTAELNLNKNQLMLIRAINKLKNEIPHLKVLLVGDGHLNSKYREVVKKLNLEKIIQFLGYRDDVVDLLSISDLAISTSSREGLPLNVMEAMASGLPLVVSDCRGNRDLIKNGVNGFVVGINDEDALANSIENLYKSDNLRYFFGNENLNHIKKFSLVNIQREMKEIYQEVENESFTPTEFQ
jgi:glycosyltransferase EpsD